MNNKFQETVKLEEKKKLKAIRKGYIDKKKTMKGEKGI